VKVTKSNGKQEWLYDEGEDTTKAVYVAKMDEIRAITGPIVQRYNDKLEEERAAAQAIADAEAAKKREMAEAAKQAAMAQEAASKDAEMPDLETTKPDEISEPEK
jgi:heat shock protein 4